MSLWLTCLILSAGAPALAQSPTTHPALPLRPTTSRPSGRLERDRPPPMGSPAPRMLPFIPPAL
ncbi:hypothetical protein FLL57_04860 [Rhodopseudomonas palustris]|nr:hypothetical protein FLL57_04860 [Rhodopseudomonas palustris]